jgi:hypothetical protein
LELSRHSPSPNLHTDGSEQRDMGHELLISVDGLLTKTTIGKFTDDYMERKGTTDLEVHPHDTHLAWIRIVTSRSARSTRKESSLDTGRACTPPGRQRGRFQHGVQGESTEWCRDHITRARSTQAYQ